jgi:hypothetical protein
MRCIRADTSYRFVSEDVEEAELRLVLAQELHDLPAEAAARRVGAALQHQHRPVRQQRVQLQCTALAFRKSMTGAARTSWARRVLMSSTFSSTTMGGSCAICRVFSTSAGTFAPASVSSTRPICECTARHWRAGKAVGRLTRVNTTTGTLSSLKASHRSAAVSASACARGREHGWLTGRAASCAAQRSAPWRT